MRVLKNEELELAFGGRDESHGGSGGGGGGGGGGGSFGGTGLSDRDQAVQEQAAMGFDRSHNIDYSGSSDPFAG